MTQEDSHWKITADAHAKILMAAQDAAGSHEDVDVIVGRLVAAVSVAQKALCPFCASENRSLPYEQHGAIAYLHHTTEGEKVACRASAVLLAAGR